METSTFIRPLRTTRLLLREMSESDLDPLYQGLSHPLVVEHYGVRLQSRDDARRQLDWYRTQAAQGGGWWGITLGAGQPLIGACGFNDYVPAHHRVETGYWLLPAYWRQGIAREAVSRLLDHGFAHAPYHRVEARVEPDNVASCALLRILGFQHEGRLREVEFDRGRYIDLDLYTLLRRDRQD
ncbi:MAG: N-acetyltransferase [Bacteroidetes bacterium]|nr:MAG: N-acetyltransferase [Bacteroidota bacterium]